jgi:hypothetical protein
MPRALFGNQRLDQGTERMGGAAGIDRQSDLPDRSRVQQGLRRQRMREQIAPGIEDEGGH